MTHAEWTAETEMRERIAVILAAAPHFLGVAELEHGLRDLRDLLASGRVERSVAVDELRDLTRTWPAGSIEILEFTLRSLKWPEMREFLQHMATSAADLRDRDRAASLLEVYADQWPDGEIYRTYRG